MANKLENKLPATDLKIPDLDAQAGEDRSGKDRSGKDGSGEDPGFLLLRCNDSQMYGYPITGQSLSTSGKRGAQSLSNFSKWMDNLVMSLSCKTESPPVYLLM